MPLLMARDGFDEIVEGEEGGRKKGSYGIYTTILSSAPIFHSALPLLVYVLFF
jgi:hypothetical protein